MNDHTLRLEAVLAAYPQGYTTDHQCNYMVSVRADDLKALLGDLHACRMTFKRIAEDEAVVSERSEESSPRQVPGESSRRVRPAPPARTAAPSPTGWRSMEDAPEDTWVIAKTRWGRILKAQFTWSCEGEEGPCGAWSVDDGDPHPECWTDGVCWSSNADGEPSDPVVCWMLLPANNDAAVLSPHGSDSPETLDEQKQPLPHTRGGEG